MSVPARIAAFVAGLALIFTVATVAGGAVDPDVAGEADGHGMESEEGTMEAHETTAAGDALPGLATSQDGYRLVPAAVTAAGPRTRYEFTVIGPGGEPVTDYEIEHARKMHLILIRRDFANFQHLHPRQLDDGSWRVEGDLSEAGVYRVFADFAIAGGRSPWRPTSSSPAISRRNRWRPRRGPTRCRAATR